ncbi:MAG: hypothetical protein ABSC56_01590 [Solirubrobacteraceae bacterium]
MSSRNPLASIALLATTLVVALAAFGALGASAAPAPAPQGFVGITSQDTFNGGEAYRAKMFSEMQASGITLIRVEFTWAQIETAPDVFNFSAYDQFVLDAAQHGIEVMPVLYEEPGWYTSRPKKVKPTSVEYLNYPPASPSDITNFVTALVKQYGPGGTLWQENPTVTPVPIRVWQVWDEPNLNFFWYPHASAKAYTALLAAASQAIHAVDPGAEVVSAGMPQSLDGINLDKFVRELVADGAGKWMNTLAVNAYSSTASGVIGILKGVRSILNAGGDSGVALRVSEIGWSDVGPKSAFRAGVKGQATQISSVINDFGANRSSLNLKGFVYFTWRDTKPFYKVKDFWGLHTGLLRLNGTAKPSLQAFTNAVAGL